MSTNALNEAPEIWGPDQAIFLFSHQLEVKKQRASSTVIARTAREEEEKDDGVLHPGFVYNDLGTILPGQRCCPLHSWTLDGGDEAGEGYY